MSDDDLKCHDCGMRVATPGEFHPHIYCVLYRAGISNPRRYLAAAMDAGLIFPPAPQPASLPQETTGDDQP